MEIATGKLETSTKIFTPNLFLNVKSTHKDDAFEYFIYYFQHIFFIRDNTLWYLIGSYKIIIVSY